MTKILFYRVGRNALKSKDSYKVTHCSNVMPLTRGRAAWLQKPSGNRLLKSLTWFIRTW